MQSNSTLCFCLHSSERCVLSVQTVIDKIAVDDVVHPKGLRRVSKESLARVWDILPSPPVVILEHAWDTRLKDDANFKLDANGDSGDGYVISYHAVGAAAAVAH